MTREFWTRLAVAVAVLAILGAVSATLLPTSPQGASCGTWVSPEWTDQKTNALVDQALELTDQSISGDIAGEGYAIASNARTAQRLCSDALGTRRTVSIVLLGLALVLPAGLLFVGGAAVRRRQDLDT